MRFPFLRGEAPYITCHKIDNCVLVSYVIVEIIVAV